MATFTLDFVTKRADCWKKNLTKFIGKPSLKAMEIGVFEGRSTIWFLSDILTHPTANITCVDKSFKPLFYDNIKPFIANVTLVKESAETALRDKKFALKSFDFIYIDGDHRASAVLEDAILCFRLLKPGGILIFDDYLYKSPFGDSVLLTPKIAIDAFLEIFKEQYRILHKAYQVIIEKVIND